MTSNVERYRRPEIIFADLLKKFAQGEFPSDSGQLSLHRAVVLAIDVEGGKLQGAPGGSVTGVNLDGKRWTYPSIPGSANPKNSVKAMVISQGLDSFYTENDARVFWPMFPADQLSLPVCPGEHVYVLFEDRHREHGLWISRVSGHDDPNFFPGAEKLEQLRGSSGPPRLNAFFDGNRTEPPAYRTDDAFSASNKSQRNLSELFGD